MNGTDWVTKFSLEKATVQDLIRELNAHLKAVNLEAEQYQFCNAQQYSDVDRNPAIPKRFWHLIAYAIEGSSEGYYVHVGAILTPERDTACYRAGRPHYMDFGFCKTWDADRAQKIANEAQKFLTATLYN